MTHCPRHRIYSPGPCPACVAEWTQQTQHAIDAYAMDQSTAAELCITCNARRDQLHRECWRCRHNRYRNTWPNSEVVAPASRPRPHRSLHTKGTT